MKTYLIQVILRKKITIKKLIAVFLFLVSLTSFSILAANKNFPPSLPDTITSVGATLPSASKINTPEYVIIRSSEETMFSSETNGQIISLPVKEGSSFNKGDTLLKLDCRLQEAELAKAKADQEATSKAFESARKLKTYGSISEFEYVKAKSEADAANADVQKLKVIVEKCNIIAPFNGGVAEIKAHLYETVKQGDPLLKVVNTDNLTFEVQVPSQWLLWLKIGSDFSVYINDINKTIPAKITFINPEIEPISQTVKIVGLITPANPVLRPGMTGQAVFKDNPQE